MRISGDGKKMALQYYSPSLKKSFSPEYGGAADSNRHIIQLDIKSCSHTYTDGTSMLVMVNENAATKITNGYTGDMYCPECEELISVGSFVKANSTSFDNGSNTNGGTNSGKNNTNGSSQDKYQSNNSPKTGDRANPAVWFTALIVSASAVYIIGRRRTKNGRR